MASPNPVIVSVENSPWSCQCPSLPGCQPFPSPADATHSQPAAPHPSETCCCYHCWDPCTICTTSSAKSKGWGKRGPCCPCLLSDFKIRNKTWITLNYRRFFLSVVNFKSKCDILWEDALVQPRLLGLKLTFNTGKFFGLGYAGGKGGWSQWSLLASRSARYHKVYRAFL